MTMFTEEEQRDNLRKLGEFLVRQPPVLYITGVHETDVCTADMEDLCVEGTDGIQFLPSEDLRDYYKRVLGVHESGVWHWCSTECWGCVDPSVRGCGHRILWYVANGIPEQAVEQSFGHAPYLFAQTKTC